MAVIEHDGTSIPTVDPKDPDATLDYMLNYNPTTNPYLQSGETISTSSWFSDSSEVTLSLSSNTTTTATIWVSGGNVGTTYTITNRITTSDGRSDDRSFYLQIKEL